MAGSAPRAVWNASGNRTGRAISSAPTPAGTPPGIPSGEHLLQRAAHIPGEPEPLGHPSGGQAVRHEASLDRPAARQDQAGRRAQAVRRGAARPDVAQRQAHHGQPGQVDAVAVAPVGGVVAEPGRDLRGVSHAAHPREHHHVVETGPGLGFDVHAAC
jgi:hypothetical protein